MLPHAGRTRQMNDFNRIDNLSLILVEIKISKAEGLADKVLAITILHITTIPPHTMPARTRQTHYIDCFGLEEG